MGKSLLFPGAKIEGGKYIDTTRQTNEKAWFDGAAETINRELASSPSSAALTS